MLTNSERKLLLVVDDNLVNRTLLKHIFQGRFEVLTAENGQEALDLMQAHPEIALVLLDLVMPVMNGFDVMNRMREDSRLRDTPVIVISAGDDMESQIRALDHGAMDVISKPFNPLIVLHRVQNILSRGENTRLAALNRAYEQKLLRQKVLLRTAELDEKTGIFGKTAFCSHAAEILRSHPEKEYVIFRWDVDNFKLLNDIYGTAEGNKRLADTGRHYRENAAKTPGLVCYGHWDADHIVTLREADGLDPDALVENIRRLCQGDFAAFEFIVRAGIYRIEDRELDVSLMCDRALLALKSIKNDYARRFAWYDDSMRAALIEEQEIVSEMENALETRQFVPYFQPQYDYDGRRLLGAEALVRWIHPEKGLIPPGRFIPVFEGNGFVSRLDAYMRRRVCEMMRGWLDAGLEICPVSVNISRREVYEPGLVDSIMELVDSFRLPHEMLHLEITESACMENPAQLLGVVSRLRENGFRVEMDDFGSGYSSLNSLSDVPLDMLKLDIKFLSDDLNPDGRKGSILSYVIRMAHWIKLAVIAEGVETREQADYLNSIGCRFMQGFYFSRPLPAAQFEELLRGAVLPQHHAERVARDFEGAANFFNASTQSTLIFNSFVGGAAIIEATENNVEALRLNDAFLREIGTTRAEYAPLQLRLTERMNRKNRALFLQMLEESKNGQERECRLQALPIREGAEPGWYRLRARYLANNVSSAIYYLSIENISGRVQRESEQLRRNHDYHLALRALNLGVVRYTPASHRLEISDSARNRFGIAALPEITPEALIAGGRVLPESIDACRAFFAAVDAGRTDVSVHLRFRFGDGSAHCCDLSCVRSSESSSHLLLVRDATQQCAAHAQGRLSCEEALAALDQNYVLALSANLTKNSWQPLGKSRPVLLAGLVGDSCDSMLRIALDQIHPDGREEFARRFSREALLELRHTGQKECTMEFRALDAASRWRWLELTVRFVESPADDEALIVAFVRDIERRKRSEETLQRALAEKDAEIRSGSLGFALLRRLTPGLIYLYYPDGSAPSLLLGSLLEAYGYAPEDLRDTSRRALAQLVYPQDRQLACESVHARIDGGAESYEAEYRLMRKNGDDPAWILERASRFVNEDGHTGYLAMLTDVTERHRLSDRLRQLEEEMRLSMARMGRMIFRYDFESRMLEVPQLFAARYGLPQTELPVGDGLSGSAILTDEGDNRERALRLAEEVRRGSAKGSDRICLRDASGRDCWQQVEYITIFDDHGKPARAILSLENLTDAQQRQLEIAHQAQHDGMTGLYNRSTIEAVIRSALAAEDHQRCALIMLDLDELKGINDHFGHAEGDSAICAVAAALKSFFRVSDAIGRIGGDEFMVFLRGIPDEARMRGLLSSLKRRLQNVSYGNGVHRQARCSVGVAFGVSGEDQFESLYRKADTALYQIKRGAKADIAVYSSDMRLKTYPLKADEAGLPGLQHALRGMDADFADTLTRVFPVMLQINLSRDQIAPLEIARPEFLRIADVSGYDHLIELLRRIAHPDDRAVLSAEWSRPVLLDAHAAGEVSRMFRLRFADARGVYRWSSGILMFAERAQEDVCAYLLASDQKLLLQNRLPASMIDAIEATALSSFESILLLHVDTGRYEMRVSPGAPYAGIPESGLFGQAADTFLLDQLVPEERAEMARRMSSAHLNEALEQIKEPHLHRYHLLDGLRETLCYAQPEERLLIFCTRRITPPEERQKTTVF